MPTKDDKTVATTKGYRYTFDAWDRLVTVKDTSNNLVAEYRYNGLGHRIGWHYDENASGTTDSSDDWFHFQYNERWQQVGMWRAGDTAPTEVFVYLNAGRDGYGGSSYIDDCVLRERDTNANGSLDERLYYLQNWRVHGTGRPRPRGASSGSTSLRCVAHGVVIMNYDGAVKERVTYDAYGRPHAFSPGDIKRTSGSADRPDGTLDANDTWTTGSVVWNKDLGNASGVAIPNNTVDANDGTTLTNLKAAGYSAGYGVLSTSAVDNRKGYAGYEFDPVLNGDGSCSGVSAPLYHVRNRVLNCHTGKWIQRDPLGYVDGPELQEYANSQPGDNTDPWGLYCAACNSNSVKAPSATAQQPTAPVVVPTIPYDPVPTGCGPSHFCWVECQLRNRPGTTLYATNLCYDGRLIICICNRAVIPGQSGLSDHVNACMLAYEQSLAAYLDCEWGDPNPKDRPKMACYKATKTYELKKCIESYVCPADAAGNPDSMCERYKAGLAKQIQCYAEWWDFICAEEAAGRVRKPGKEVEKEWEEFMKKCRARQ